MRRRRGAWRSLVLSLVVAAVASAPGVAGASERAAETDRPEAAAEAPVDGAIADLAWELEFDVERIFRFVADEIRYQPYVGILRGAHGTLAARAGNSVDQALLLAALLDESVIPYRFARGPLDEEAAAEIMDSITTDVAEARRIAEEDLGRGFDELVGDEAAVARLVPDAPVDDAEAAARATADEARERLELAESQLEATITSIDAALDEAGIALPADEVSLPASEVDGHTWVQVASGADWIDLDPTLAASQPAAALTGASVTLERLPDDLRHRVEFEVLVERVVGGSLATESVLEHAVFADEIAGEPVTFGHIVPSSVERFGVTLRTILGDGWIEYRPTLEIGPIALVADEAVAFGLAGAEGGGGLFGGTDLFADETPSAEQAGPVDGEATAEWLVVRVVAPGAEPAVARRTVFDRVPADVRQAGAATVEAVEPVDVIVPGDSGTPEVLPMLTLEAFAVATGPTSLAAILERIPDDELGTVALAYHGLRDAMGAGMGLDAGARTFLDGANVVSFEVGIDELDEVPTFSVGLDIWHRSHGVLPLEGASMNPAAAELTAGVVDHLAERATIEGLAGPTDVHVRRTGVGALFEAAATEGVPTAVLHGAVPAGLPYGTAAALIEEAVEAGDVVIVPAKPVTLGGRERVGWWRIDPVTGVTIDVMDDAAGTETVEYHFQVGTRWYACKGASALGARATLMASAALAVQLGFPFESTAMWRLFSGPSPPFDTVCYNLL